MATRYCPLAAEALLHIEGPDSLTFLQGQTSCDTREISPEQAALGVYCTPQGRVVCDFLLSQLGPDHYALRLRRTLREQAAAVFAKYIVFSKAELDDKRDDWRAFGIWGDEAAQDLRAIFPQLPAGALACTSGEDFLLVQLDPAGERFECYLKNDSPLLHNMTAELALQQESEWQRLDIVSGIARIELPIVESEVPQVLNYDLTGHVRFDKGCYTGQEVVARLHYRGKSKRRSYLVHLSAEAASGEPVFVAGNSQSTGTIINTVSEEPFIALAALTTASLEDDLRVGDPQGPRLEVGQLPYSVADAPEAS